MSDPITPAQVLEHNIKHFEGVAAAMRADSEKALRKASEADAQAEVFRRALSKLEGAH